jgi:uncharacterized membrane protein
MDAEAMTRQYVGRLRRALGCLQAAEVDDIVLEIRGHIAERVAEGTESTDRLTETVGMVLDGLGDPEALAAEYLTEAVLARGRASRSPLTVLVAVQGWATEGLLGLLSFLVGVLGYGVAAALVLVAVLKPFFPLNVGLWWSPPGLMALGFVSGSPDPQSEVLGWWILLLGLLGGGLLWLGTTRLLGALLRRYRSFASPLDAHQQGAARVTP